MCLPPDANPSIIARGMATVQTPLPEMAQHLKGFRIVAAMALQVSVSASFSDAMKIMTQTAYPMANQRSKLRVKMQRMSSSTAPRQKTGPKSPIQPVSPKTG